MPGDVLGLLEKHSEQKSNGSIERGAIVWNNPVRFYAQSGALEENVEGSLAVDQRALFEGNSVLRGQTPRVEG